MELGAGPMCEQAGDCLERHRMTASLLAGVLLRSGQARNCPVAPCYA